MTIRRLSLLLALTGALWPALAGASLTPSPAALDLGPRDIHEFSPVTQAVRLTNQTGAASQVSETTVTGEGFSLQSGCAGQTLPDGAHCDVVVGFQPASAGPATGTLRVTDDTGVVDIPLSGTGITGTLAADPVTFEARPASWGDAYAWVNLVETSGVARVRVTGWSFSGPEASRFSLDTGCVPGEIWAGGGCGVGVRMARSEPGTYRATLEIHTDGTVATVLVPLEVVVLNGPRVDPSPGLLEFGDVPVGQTREALLRFTNGGDWPLGVQQTVMLTGRPGALFMSTDGCSRRELQPGEGCEVAIRFAPTRAGDVDASLFLIVNSDAPVFPVGISGVGVAPAAPAPAPARETMAFSVAPPAPTLAPAPEGRADDLSRAPGSFVDRESCRVAEGLGPMGAGAGRIGVRAGSPLTPTEPLTLRARSAIALTLGGHRAGLGRSIALSPRRLAGLPDGPHEMRVTSAGVTRSGLMVLRRCDAALRVIGGPGQGATLAVSSRTALREVQVRLPRGLRLATRPAARAGSAVLREPGRPARGIVLTGPVTVWNGVRVALDPGGARVTGLPAGVGSVTLLLRPGVLSGSGGAVRAAALTADGGFAVRARATWLR
jgi:hypothetical protein